VRPIVWVPPRPPRSGVSQPCPLLGRNTVPDVEVECARGDPPDRRHTQGTRADPGTGRQITQRKRLGSKRVAPTPESPRGTRSVTPVRLSVGGSTGALTLAPPRAPPPATRRISRGVGRPRPRPRTRTPPRRGARLLGRRRPPPRARDRTHRRRRDAAPQIGRAARCGPYGPPVPRPGPLRALRLARAPPCPRERRKGRDPHGPLPFRMSLAQFVSRRLPSVAVADERRSFGRIEQARPTSLPSSYNRRSRTPRAGWPGRSRCRTSRSRGRRRPTATRTSPTWPPRWARPGCCGSAGDPCRPG